MIIAEDFTVDSSGNYDPVTVPDGAWGARRIRVFEKQTPSHQYYLAHRANPATSERSLHTLGQVHEFSERVYQPGEILAYIALDSGSADFTIEAQV